VNETAATELKLETGGADGDLCRLDGVLDFSSVPQLAGKLPALFQRRQPLTVDLSGVSRSDSAGMALLLEMQRLARESQCRLTLRHLPQSLRNIIRMSELDSVLPLSD